MKLLILALMLLTLHAYAEEPAAITSLPNPLTLEFALSLAANDHPDNIESRSRIQTAEAIRQKTSGEAGLHTTLEGRLRWVEPSDIAANLNHEDHRLALTARKRLYDFGRTDAMIMSAESVVDAEHWRWKEQQSQRRIEIMQAFFDVILADLAYARDNELMAIKFVRFDRAKDQNQLGQLADVKLLEAESAYYKTRSVRYASDVRRRSSRSHLANLLNYPGDLPATLVRPKLSVLERTIPEYEVLQQQAMENNPLLQSLRDEVESASQRLLSARARKKPTIDLQLQAAEYSRELGSSDKLRGGVVLSVPLSSGGAIDADIAEQRSRLTAAQARLRRAEMATQQQVLDAWQLLSTVKAQRDEARVFSEFRDAALDRDRGLYELDVAADLGDSLALYSAALHQTAKAEFDYAIAWAKLDALMGKTLTLQDAPSRIDKK